MAAAEAAEAILGSPHRRRRRRHHRARRSAEAAEAAAGGGRERERERGGVRAQPVREGGGAAAAAAAGARRRGGAGCGEAAGRKWAWPPHAGSGGEERARRDARAPPGLRPRRLFSSLLLLEWVSLARVPGVG